MKAYKAAYFNTEVAIIKSTSRERAKSAYWRSAHAAGVKIKFTDIRIVRACEYDKYNLEENRPVRLGLVGERP